MTKSQMYSTGVVAKDPTTGKDVQGRYRVNPNSGEFERTDLSFGEHWANRPNAIKYSPALSLLYAGGKNISEFFKNKNFKGYNEAGLVTGTSWKSDGTGSNGGNGGGGGGNGMSESQMMHAVSPHARQPGAEQADGSAWLKDPDGHYHLRQPDNDVSIWSLVKTGRPIGREKRNGAGMRQRTTGTPCICVPHEDQRHG